MDNHVSPRHRSGASAQSKGALAGAWVTTGFVALAMTFSGVLYLVGPRPVVEGFHRLGYPDYFRTLLGVAKLLGVAAILGAGSRSTIREWAYAGFTFDLVAAAFSHAMTGDGRAAVFPLLLLAALSGSYLWWHRPRARSELHAIEPGRAARLLSPVQDAGGPR